MRRQAPFHRDKNSIADAVLLEIYKEIITGDTSDHVCFGFASINYRDFSKSDGNFREPHPDLATLFSNKSIYITDIRDFITLCDPLLEQNIGLMYDLAPDFRSLSDLTREEERLSLTIWYDRHKMREARIKKGEVKLVSHSMQQKNGYRSDEILDSVWQDALKAAAEVETRYGRENLGPWSDFEWGMLKGKLSAIRWMLGYEWDMLDT